MRPTEIDHHTLKLVVGVIAIGLANATNLFAAEPLTSISASYHEGGWARDIFVGCLFAIGAFLLAYNGYSTPQMIVSKLAALAAIGVAMFPCECDGREQILRGAHAASAAVMFLALAFFCWAFYKRARGKGRREADRRAIIYATCGLVIFAAILVLGVNQFTGGVIGRHVPRLTFYGEWAALLAFGVSWLVASRVLPVITARDERIHLFEAAKGSGLDDSSG